MAPSLRVGWTYVGDKRVNALDGREVTANELSLPPGVRALGDEVPVQVVNKSHWISSATVIGGSWPGGGNVKQLETTRKAMGSNSIMAKKGERGGKASCTNGCKKVWG